MNDAVGFAYSKPDENQFLSNQQSNTNKTFKKNTLLSGWRQAGMLP